MSDETRSNVKKQLEAVLAFMASPAFSSYKRTIEQDISGVEPSIIGLPPARQEDIVALLILHGRREELTSNLTFFEDARVTLETRLKDIESEQPNATIV